MFLVPVLICDPPLHQVSVTHLPRLFGIVVEMYILTILLLIIVEENYHFQFHFTFSFTSLLFALSRITVQVLYLFQNSQINLILEMQFYVFYSVLAAVLQLDLKCK